MVAPIRFLTGRQQQQKIGVIGSTEDTKVLEVVGRVGIGTVIFDPIEQFDLNDGNAIFRNSVGIGTTNIFSGGSTNSLTLDGKIVVGNAIGSTNLSNALSSNVGTGVSAYRSFNLIDTSSVVKIVRASSFTAGPAIELQHWNENIDTQYGYWDLISERGHFAFRDRINSGNEKNRIFISNNGNVLIGSTSGNIGISSDESVGFGTDNILQVNGNVYLGGDVGIGTTNPTADLDVVGLTELDNLNVSGIATIVTFGVIGLTTTKDLEVTGIATFKNDVKLFGPSNAELVWDSSEKIFRFNDDVSARFGDDDDLKLFHNGTDSFISDSGTGNLRLTSDGLGVTIEKSGTEKIADFNTDGSVDLYYDGSNKFQTTGVGVSIVNGTSDTATIYGPSNLIIDPMPVGVGTTSGIVRIKGDLYVDGTQFVVASSTIELADFVVGIATTVPNDLLLDGAGIGIGTNKTFLYEYNSGTNPSLKSSENLNVSSGKHYQIGEVEVLSSTTLGSGVVNSSLTSLGTIATGVWQGTAINDDYIDTIDNANKVSLSALNIDGGTDIGALLSDGDLFIVDDGANGTNRKADILGITTYTFGKVSGDIVISAAGTATIQANSVGLGTDTFGQYASTITGGGGLTATTPNADDGTAYTINVGAGTGITVNADDVAIKNADNLTDNKVVKWDDSNGQLTNSVITDDGTNVGIGSTQPTAKLDVNGTLNVSGITTTGTLYVGAAGTIGITSILDEDDMVSDSDTALATQQSIKAYVDAQVTAQDLDFAGDTGTGAVDLDTQSLTIAGTASEIETSASGQTLTIGLPNQVAITTSLVIGSATTITGSGIVAGIITATTFESTVASGTAPFVVASTTQVTNLNANYLNGYASAVTNTANGIVRRDASGDFSAGTITANLTGTATTATNLSDGANITTGTISDDRLPDLITSNINIASGISSVATLDATNATIDNLTFTSGTAIISVDTDLTTVSGSDNTLASAKAIKTYVDAQVTAQDLDFAGDTGTGAVDLDSQTFTIAGTANEIETVGSGVTLTIGLPNQVAITTSLVVGSGVTITGSGIVAGIITGTLDNTLTLDTFGNGISGSATYNNSGVSTFTVTSDATSANSGSTIVFRDGSGNFSAGTITANLTGTATTATNLANGANITTGTISDDRLPDLITSNINIASGISSVATLDATNATIDNLTFTSGTAITSVDTDLTTVSGSDDTLASAKAIKAYVDSEVSTINTSIGNINLDIQGDTGGALSIDLDSETLTIAGTANEIETVGSGNTITIGLPNDVTISNDLTVSNNLNVSGVSTFQGNVNLGDNDILYFGDGNDGYLYFDSNNLILHEGSATGSFLLRGQNLRLQNPSNSNENWIEALNDGTGRTVRLFYNGSNKFETTGYGVTVSGGAYVSGIATFQNNIEVTGNIGVNDTTVVGSATASLSTVTETAIHTGLSTSTYRSVEYNIQATQGTNYHVTKILALHNGTTAYHNEYGTIFNNTSVATFNVDVSGGNIRLLGIGATSDQTDYVINFTATKI